MLKSNKDYSKYINQWPQFELYTANNKLQCYELVDFIVNKVFEYNMMDIELLNLSQKIDLLATEEIISLEIKELLKEGMGSNYKHKLEEHLLEWFWMEYQNYEKVFNKYNDKVFQHYGNTQAPKKEINMKLKNEEIYNDKSVNKFKIHILEINKKFKHSLEKCIKKLTLKNFKSV